MEVLDVCPLTRWATLPPRDGAHQASQRRTGEGGGNGGKKRLRSERGVPGGSSLHVTEGEDDSNDDGGGGVGGPLEVEDAATRARRVQSAFPHLCLPLEAVMECATDPHPRPHLAPPPHPSLVSCRLGVTVTSSLGSVGACVPVVAYAAGPGGHLLRLQQVTEGRVRCRGRAKWCGDVPLPARITALCVAQHSSSGTGGSKVAVQGRARKAAAGTGCSCGRCWTSARIVALTNSHAFTIDVTVDKLRLSCTVSCGLLLREAFPPTPSPVAQSPGHVDLRSGTGVEEVRGLHGEPEAEGDDDRGGDDDVEPGVLQRFQARGEGEEEAEEAEVRQGGKPAQPPGPAGGAPSPPTHFVCTMQGGGRVLLVQSRPPRLCLWLPDNGAGARCDLVSADPALPCAQLVGATVAPSALSCAWVLGHRTLYTLRLHGLEAAVALAAARSTSSISSGGSLVVQAPAQLLTPALSMPSVERRRRGRAAAKAVPSPVPTCQLLQVPATQPGAPPPRFLAMASPPWDGEPERGAYLALALTSGAVLVDGSAATPSPLLQWQLPLGVRGPLLWRSDGTGGHVLVVSTAEPTPCSLACLAFRWNAAVPLSHNAPLSDWDHSPHPMEPFVKGNAQAGSSLAGGTAGVTLVHCAATGTPVWSTLGSWDVLPPSGFTSSSAPTLLALFSTGDLTLVTTGTAHKDKGPDSCSAAEDSDDDRSVASLANDRLPATTRSACSLLRCPPPALAAANAAVSTRPSGGAVAHFLARCSAVFDVEEPVLGDAATLCAALTTTVPASVDTLSAGACGCGGPALVADSLDRCRVCHPGPAGGGGVPLDRPDATVDAAGFLGRIPPPSKLLQVHVDSSRLPRHRTKRVARGDSTRRRHDDSEEERAGEHDGSEGDNMLAISLAAVRPPRQGPVRVVDLSAAHALGFAALVAASGAAADVGAWVPPLQACLAELQGGPLSLFTLAARLSLSSGRPCPLRPLLQAVRAAGDAISLAPAPATTQATTHCLCPVGHPSAHATASPCVSPSCALGHTLVLRAIGSPAAVTVAPVGPADATPPSSPQGGGGHVAALHGGVGTGARAGGSSGGGAGGGGGSSLPLESQLGTQSSFLSLLDDLATLSQQPSSLEEWALPESPPRGGAAGELNRGGAGAGAGAGASAAEPGSASVRAAVLLGEGGGKEEGEAPGVPRTARLSFAMRRELQEAWL